MISCCLWINATVLNDNTTAVLSSENLPHFHLQTLLQPTPESPTFSFPSSSLLSAALNYILHLRNLTKSRKMMHRTYLDVLDEDLQT